MLVRSMKFNLSITLNMNLVPVTFNKFFPRDFFKKVSINMVPCSKLGDENDEEDE